MKIRGIIVVADREFVKKQRILAHLSESRIRYHIQNTKKENPNLSQNEILLGALHGFLEPMIKVYPESKDKFEILFSDLIKTPNNSETDFIKIVSQRTSQYLASRFSKEELEAISRRSAIFKNKELNRLVNYSFNKNTLELHANLVFIDSPMRLKRLFIDALKKLAQKLINDPELAEIENISAKSWIVCKAKRAFKIAGFTIIEINLENNYGKAVISKAKFLRLYR